MAQARTTNETEEYYVFLGEMQEDGELLPEGVMHISSASYRLYSPRTTNLTNNPIIFRDRAKVYYYTHSTTYADMYEFIFACRASKNTDNYYLMKMVTSVKELKEQALKPYNIVSGDKFPVMNNSEKKLAHKYLMMGLHLYWTYVKCGLSATKIATINANVGGSSQAVQSRTVSAGGHRFRVDEGWVINVSLVFPGTLIDYYRIESGTIGVNAQLAFIKDPEYRYLVYRYIRDIFFAFIKHNLPQEAHQNVSLMRSLETVGALSDNEIILLAGSIIGSLIEQ